MRTVLVILSFTSIFIAGCKKSGNGPDPIPPAIIKPDTIGAGWKKMVLDPSLVYSDIFFISNSVGFLAGNKAYKTFDGGLTWTAISSTGGFGNIAATANGNAFFSGGGNDSVYKYTSGGTTVSAKQVPG